MIFKRSRKGAGKDSGSHVMRGRDRVGNAASTGTGSNPLARRFHADDEPDTIDLQQTGDPPAAADRDHEESATRDLAAGAGAKSSVAPRGEGFSVIRYVPETGKFYLQPGPDDHPVCLGESPVYAPTELRHGDRIEVGDSELVFRPAQSDP
jgi:hypothetical protein